MTDVTFDLPNRIKKSGGKLFAKSNGPITKFVLIVAAYDYRGFIYVRVNEREADSSLKDLFNEFYYKNNIRVIANT